MIGQILAFLMTLGASSFLTVIVRNLARRHGWLHSAHQQRHIHSRPMPRLGGVAIYISFVLAVVLALTLFPHFTTSLPISKNALMSIIAPASLVFALGLYDDVFGSSPYLKFGVQTVAAIWLYLANISIERIDLLHGEGLRTMVGLPLTIFWVLLITNAFNLIDGLDGLTAGSALFTAIVLCVQSMISDSYEVAFLAVLLAGAILGFLRFNYHPATIFLGDSGSLFIGFLISALALAGSQKSTIMLAVAIPVVSCGLPILDVALAVMRRYMNGKPLFDADQDHIHHKLLKLGFSQRNAVLTLYAASACFAVVSLLMFHGGTLVALLVLVTGVGVYAGLRHLHYEEFGELRRLIQQLFRQREIIRNNLRVRRVARLLESCEDAADFVGLMEEALRPLGFFGYRLSLTPDEDTSLLDAASPHLHRVGSHEYVCNWFTPAGEESLWAIRLHLQASCSSHSRTLTIFRAHDAETLLLDVNVLTSTFQQALVQVLQRFALAYQAASRG
jgi:UDP-GlcNAc:undecaprenyl-phosphate/decaprenyl-phosphate GlcNAc-1-phosphate transferase